MFKRRKVCHTLRFWLDGISSLFMTLSSGLERNYTSEWSSKSFPVTTSMSGWLENFQKYIPKSVVLQSRGQGPKVTDMSRTLTRKGILSPGLEYNKTFKCIYDSFPGILTYLMILKKCWNSTPMSPISGTKS